MSGVYVVCSLYLCTFLIKGYQIIGHVFGDIFNSILAFLAGASAVVGTLPLLVMKFRPSGTILPVGHIPRTKEAKFSVGTVIVSWRLEETLKEWDFASTTENTCVQRTKCARI